MSYTRATVLAFFSLLAGGALLVFLLRNVSPYRSDDELNPLALLTFMLSVFLMTGGGGVLTALALHRRWPALAGIKTRRRPLTAEAALRQGVLLGLTAVTLLAMAMLQVLDVAVLIVTLLVAGLIEAYVQSRG